MAAKTAPKPTFPTVNFDAFVALQKANVETFVQAQGIVLDAAQAIAKLQYSWISDAMKGAEVAFDAGATAKKPEEYMADAKTAAEKVMSVAKQELDLGIKAQTEVADLVAKRVAANLEEVRTIAS